MFICLFFFNGSTFIYLLSYLFCKYVHAHMYVWGYPCHMCVKVRGQLTGFGSLLPPGGYLGLNSGHRTHVIRQQMPLPPLSSGQPLGGVLFCFVMCCFAMPGIKPRALYLLEKNSPSGLCLQPFACFPPIVTEHSIYGGRESTSLKKPSVFLSP